MKKVALVIFAISAFVLSCKTVGTMASIDPKAGTIELPSKGEFKIWKDKIHPSFSVVITNPSSTQSCEIYKVTDSGSEKWIQPSLQAGKSITVKVPSNGHLFFKNFNTNTLSITYKIEE